MLSIAWANIRGQAPRFMMTWLAITLGVGLVTGVSSLCTVINDTFAKMIGDTSRSMDVFVRPLASDSIGLFDRSGRTLPLDFDQTLHNTAGTATVQPFLLGSATLVGDDGSAVRRGQAPTLGISYDPNDPGMAITAGRAPATDYEILAEQATLKMSGLAVGDTTDLVVNGDRRHVTIVGEATMASYAGMAIVLLDKPTAVKAFAPEDRVAKFIVRAEPDVTPSQLADNIRPSLPEGYEAITAAQFRDEKTDQTQSRVGFITVFLMLFSGVSLLAGAFIIVNTFLMVLAQRAKQLAMLRAIGMHQRQVVGLILFEAIVLGLFGAAGGLAAGIALANGLLKVTNQAMGFAVDGVVTWSVEAAAQAAALGVGMCVVAAIIPAFLACRIAPVAVMRQAAGASSNDGGVAHPLRVQASFAMFLTVEGIGLAVLCWPADGWIAQTYGRVPMAIAGALIVVGTFLAAAPAVHPAVSVLSAPMRLGRDIVADLAHSNSARSPHRAAVTAVALTVGLAMVCGIGVLSSSAWASTRNDVQSQLDADFIAQGPITGLPHELIDQAKKVDGVDLATPLTEVTVRVGDRTRAGTATVLNELPEAMRISVTDGHWGDVTTSSIVVDSGIADDENWQAGDNVEIGLGDTQRKTVQVAAIYQGTSALSGILIPSDMAQENFGPNDQIVKSVLISAQEEADLDAVRQGMLDITEPMLTVDLQNQDDYSATRGQELKQILGIINSLLALAVFIAGLGVANTLGMSIFERTREIGMLRAIGLKRSQLWRMVTLEALWLAIFGALLGVALGLGLGVLAANQLRADGLTAISVPWETVMWVFVSSCIIGVVAAFAPALRASRMNVLDAITPR